MEEEQYEYAGFWIRVGATLIDTALLMLITVPLLTYTYGWNSFFDSARGLVAGVADFLISYIVPAVALVVFCMFRQATPGKIQRGTVRSRRAWALMASGHPGSRGGSHVQRSPSYRARRLGTDLPGSIRICQFIQIGYWRDPGAFSVLIEY